MDQLVCRACASPNVVPDAVVYDHGASTWAPLHVSVPLANPEPGLLARVRDSAALSARLCGDCGLVEFHAADAARLWAAARS